MPSHRSSVEGRVYRFRSETECEELRLTLSNEITKVIRQHMVLALGRVPERPGYVEVMTVTTKDQSGQNLPISPTPKRHYPLQLRFINPLPENVFGGTLMRFTTLPKLSYLRVDKSYEVPLSALEDVIDGYGNQPMLRLKGHGGIRHLLQHLRATKHRQLGNRVLV
ncbi:hypothetical protein EJ04DRAFT_29673 [Polyplosphaeria fusca]|uniref:Uncharacterized protein n=1 Tax=Polyplosphaeria fusca TaxID=682080 RepID=A0A9P4UXZ7_9PLEO|nr:hypothetical protein EJ04DRAFT_29673 [Polyplosphaeria fusca]